MDWELDVQGVSAGDGAEFEGYKIGVAMEGALLVLGMVRDSQPISAAHIEWVAGTK